MKIFIVLAFAFVSLTFPSCKDNSASTPAIPDANPGLVGKWEIVIKSGFGSGDKSTSDISITGSNLIVDGKSEAAIFDGKKATVTTTSTLNGATFTYIDEYVMTSATTFDLTEKWGANGLFQTLSTSTATKK
jgi:hypothetical protein